MNNRNARLNRHFLNHEPYRSAKDNREVNVIPGRYNDWSCSIAYLYNSAIAVRGSLGVYAFSMGGWRTVTTGSALKALAPWGWHYERGRIKCVKGGSVVANYEVPYAKFIVLDAEKPRYLDTLEETVSCIYELEEQERLCLPRLKYS